MSHFADALREIETPELEALYREGHDCVRRMRTVYEENRNLDPQRQKIADQADEHAHALGKKVLAMANELEWRNRDLRAVRMGN